jgi:trigger factor
VDQAHHFVKKDSSDWKDVILKIETQELENRQVEMKVEVPAEQVEKAMRAAARRLSKQTKIPGFRPGKAPYEIIVGKFGEEVVFEEALDNLGQDVYRTGLEQSELEPYAPGMLEEIESRDPLLLRYVVPLAPEIDLGDYHALRVPFEEPDVTDEAFEEALEELRQRQALIEPADRPAQDSDLVILDVYGELLEGEMAEKQLIDSKEVSVLVDPETDFPVPGIYEHIKGISAGEERAFNYSFTEDYAAEDLRGKQAHFKITCAEVKSRLVPDWSDDLAQNLGDFETLLDLRLKLRESLQEQANQENHSRYADEVLDTLLEQASVAYPPVVLEEELARSLRELELRLQGQNLTLEDYLKIEDKSEQDLKDELEPAARARIERGLVLGKLVDLEKLEIEDNEIQDEIDRMMAPFEGKEGQELRKAFENNASRSRIAIDLLTGKALTRLTNLARGITEEDLESQIEAEPTAVEGESAGGQADNEDQEKPSSSTEAVEVNTEKE